MSMCSISPVCKGIAVSPFSCFLGCLSYLALAQVLQLCTISLANLAILGK